MYFTSIFAAVEGSSKGKAFPPKRDIARSLHRPMGEVGKNKRESLIAPGEEFLKDPKKKQGWMIWAGETQSYTLADDGFQIVNGKATYNRPLYGINDSSVVLAGDKPQIMMADSPSTKYGNLSIGVISEKESKWFHNFSHIIATYDPGMMKYELSDPLLPDATVFLDVVPLKNRAGFIAKIYADRKISFVWAYGGMSDGYSIDGQGGLQGGILSEECKENEIEQKDGFFQLKKPTLPKMILGGCSLSGEYIICNSKSSDEPTALINSQPTDTPILAHITTLEEKTPCYILISLADSEEEGKAIKEMLGNAHSTYTISIDHYRKLQSQVVVDTPDDKLDMAVKGISISIDSCWRPPSFLHGALRWGSGSGGWYLGWRGWYGSSAFGWHERVKEAIKFHSQFQLQTPREVRYRDTGREEGPNSRGKVAPFVSFSHEVGGGYDMTQIYLDHIYYHYHWTGDKDLMKEIFPTIKLALEWEKREFDPDDDGLYENYANTFISDGHWYSGGGCTQASAYNYRANLMAAEIAPLMGDDPTPYKEEAEKIKKAVNSVLWLKDKGYFAEYKDLLGLKRVHNAAEAPTIYHPIDFYLTDDFQSYQALRYIENRLWKENDIILVNDWYPVIVTNGTIVFTETLNTILCYYRIGEVEKAYKLLKSCINPFYQARVPGTISCYGGTEAQQGTYVDFNDAVSMFGRVIVEGLLGILPKMQEQKVTIQPGFPLDWNEAKIKTPDIEYEYKRENFSESLHVATTKPTKKRLRLIAKQDRIEKVTLDGEEVEYNVEAGVGRAFIVVETPLEKEAALNVTYRESTGKFDTATPADHSLSCTPVGSKGESYEVFANSCELLELNDPQGVLSDIQLKNGVLKAQINASPGHRTFFLLAKNGDVSFWQPVDLEVREPLDITDGKLLISKTESGKVLYSFTLRNNLPQALNLEVTSRFLEEENTESITISPYSSHAFIYKLKEISALTPGTNNLSLSIGGDKVKNLNVPIKFWSVFQGLPSQGSSIPLHRPIREDFFSRLVFVPLDYNDRLEDIFTHDYTSPRSPYSSLEIDIHGLNAWTGSWYKTDYVNTEHIREMLDDNGIFTSDIGVPFKQVREGNNGVFVSLWDNFPAEITIPVNIKAKKAYLLIAGSTHNAQSYIENGEITVRYSDGTEDTVGLFNPTNYDSIFQHFSENYPQWIGGAKEGYYGVGTASGVHADILDIPLADRMVERIHLRCLSNEVIIGVLGLTLVVS